MHKSVLLNEVLQYLDPKPGENFVDCTLGLGGHTTAILEQTSPEGKVLGIDWDGESIKVAESGIRNKELGFKARIIAIEGNFANIGEIVKSEKFGPVHGVLMDLGWSSWQLEKGGKGFSFLHDEPLDMRLQTNDRRQTTDNEQALTAEDVVNTYTEEDLKIILQEYGEERFAGRIARQIVEKRKQKRILRTIELAEVISNAVPAQYRRGKIHPATRTFQALRIVVNNELENLRKGLEGALRVMEPGGRIAVISFHSLEDRIVKNFIRDHKKEGLVAILTKKPITPSDEEISHNPRSRSAKMRAALKMENGNLKMKN